jgi:hypothetical protein
VTGADIRCHPALALSVVLVLFEFLRPLKNFLLVHFSRLLPGAFSPDLPARLGSVSRLKFQFFVAISVHYFFRRVRQSRLDFRFSLQVR